MRVRVGFIGIGGISAVHLQHVHEHEHAVVAAVCSTNEGKVKEAAAKYGAPGYTNYEDMLENESLDALIVCVPPTRHEQIEEKAAERGIHLLVEKPLGLDLETVRKKEELIRTSGIIAGSGYCLRYLETAERAMAYLAGKKIAMIRGYYYTSYGQANWWRSMAQSGGQFVEQATHMVDLMRYIAGDVGKLYADMDRLTLSDIVGMDIPDVSSVNLVFRSGAVGHIDALCNQHEFRTGAEILGRDFRMFLDWSTITISDRLGTVTYESECNFHRKQDHAFIEAVMTGDRRLIRSPYDDAVKSLEATLAANESACTGKPIVL